MMISYYINSLYGLHQSKYYDDNSKFSDCLNNKELLIADPSNQVSKVDLMRNEKRRNYRSSRIFYPYL
jgi:hypothetical protein